MRFTQPTLKELCPMTSKEPCMFELHATVPFRLCCPTSPWLIQQYRNPLGSPCEPWVALLQAAAAAKRKAAAEKQRAEDRAPTATVQLSERFYARPADLYDCFTNLGRVQAFSQSPAQVSSPFESDCEPVNKVDPATCSQAHRAKWMRRVTEDPLSLSLSALHLSHA